MANRDTNYATEIATATFCEPSGSEARIEKLFIKAQGQEGIRFSWWRDGQLKLRPLDLPEHELLLLFREAIRKEVFSPQFLADLRVALEQSLCTNVQNGRVSRIEKAECPYDS
jgi:hypothetical protein